MKDKNDLNSISHSTRWKHSKSQGQNWSACCEHANTDLYRLHQTNEQRLLQQGSNQTDSSAALIHSLFSQHTHAHTRITHTHTHTHTHLCTESLITLTSPQTSPHFTLIFFHSKVSWSHLSPPRYSPLISSVCTRPSFIPLHTSSLAHCNMFNPPITSLNQSAVSPLPLHISRRKLTLIWQHLCCIFLLATKCVHISILCFLEVLGDSGKRWRLGDSSNSNSTLPSS